MPDNDLTASGTPEAATGTDRDREEEARYVPVVEMLMDRTTPMDLPSIDIGLLARLDRKRKRRRTALASVTAVAAVVGLTAGTVALTSGADKPPEVGIAPAGPDGQPLSEPVGAWRQAADPPFEPRHNAFSGTLSDGRMFIWGGSNGGYNPHPTESHNVPTGLRDGGIYDPETDTWEEIPPAPVPPPTQGGADITNIHLVGDRLAIITGGADGGVSAAVYDVAAGRWVDAPTQDTVTDVYDASAWDGETLVLVRAREGEANTDQPVTLRWKLGDESWTTGAPFPHGVRNLVGRAFDDSYIAVWGGTPEQFIDMDEPRETYGDGAVYDIAEDVWQLIPEGPLTPGTHAEVTWLNGRLVVGSRQGEEARYERPADMAAYDPVSETWEMLPSPPEHSAGVVGYRGGWRMFIEGEEPLLAAIAFEGASEIKQRWFFMGGGWEQAPLPGLHRVGDFVVADSQGVRVGGTDDGAPYELKVRVGPDEWLDAAEASFDNHDTLAKASSDSRMLVIVGDEDEEAPPTEHTAWVFDLASSD